MADARFKSFEEFWPFYVGEHAKASNRAMHFVGTNLGLLNLAAAVALRNPWFLLTGVVTGYAFAWVGHFFIEKNRPATFTYPGWSFRGDFRMLGLMWRGRMTAEVERLARRTGDRTLSDIPAARA